MLVFPPSNDVWKGKNSLRREVTVAEVLPIHKVNKQMNVGTNVSAGPL